MAIGSILSKYDVNFLKDPTLYRTTVEALQFCVLIRPEIAFFVNKYCQFIHSPIDAHWKATKRVHRYLKCTCAHGLNFIISYVLEVIGFSNYGWVSGSDDRCNIATYCVYLVTIQFLECPLNRRLLNKLAQSLDIEHLCWLHVK